DLSYPAVGVWESGLLVKSGVGSKSTPGGSDGCWIGMMSRLLSSKGKSFAKKNLTQIETHRVRLNLDRMNLV
ncbi:MAG: hypothetical protein KAH97_04985, partial [Anaerolineales bacterium]|nr:hypothetical protein [Anaerolineales bacterium]